MAGQTLRGPDIHPQLMGCSVPRVGTTSIQTGDKLSRPKPPRQLEYTGGHAWGGHLHSITLRSTISLDSCALPHTGETRLCLMFESSLSLTSPSSSHALLLLSPTQTSIARAKQPPSRGSQMCFPVAATRSRDTPHEEKCPTLH
jgi:hypothetical protein